jgi:hypothetical protein
VQLDTGFGGPEPCPREQRQAEINRTGVQSIDGLGGLESKIFPQIQSAGFMNELLGEVGVDAPVAALIGIGQRTA